MAALAVALPAGALPVAPVVLDLIAEHVEPALQRRWVSFAGVAAHEGAPPVTTGAPVGTWVGDVKTGWAKVGLERRAVLVCAAGLAVTDFLTWSVGMARGQVRVQPSVCALALVSFGLAPIAAVAPGCSVRDAMGWSLVYGVGLSRPVRGARDILDVAERKVSTGWVQQWLAAGFSMADHAYAAAGLGPTEAAALRACGELPDADALALMVGLRGTLVPAVVRD